MRRNTKWFEAKYGVKGIAKEGKSLLPEKVLSFLYDPKLTKKDFDWETDADKSWGWYCAMAEIDKEPATPAQLDKLKEGVKFLTQGATSPLSVPGLAKFLKGHNKPVKFNGLKGEEYVYLYPRIWETQGWVFHIGGVTETIEMIDLSASDGEGLIMGDYWLHRVTLQEVHEGLR